MKELRRTVIHHIEQAAIAAGVRCDFDCRRELEADFDAAEQRIAHLERSQPALENPRSHRRDE